MKKFLLSLAGLAVAMAANATDIYLIGGFNNWKESDPDCKFTEGTDGVYTLDYQGTLTSGFKLNDGTWKNDEMNFGSNGDKLVPGTPYVVGVGGSTSDIKTDGNITNPHIVFDLATNTLTVSGAAVEAEYVYGVHGSIFDETEEWTTEKMTESNGVWTLTADVLPGDFGIKQMDKATDAQTGWAALPEDGEPKFGTPFEVSFSGNKNINIAEAGKYTFTFDPSAMTLMVSDGSVKPDPTPADGEFCYNLRGDIFTGEWEDKGMELKNGAWVLENVTVTTGSFGIKKISVATEEQVAWIASAGEPAITVNSDNQGKENGSNWTIKKGTYTFTFNPTTLVLNVSGTESNEPDPETVVGYMLHTNMVGGAWSSHAMTESNGVWTLTAEVVPGEFGVKKVDTANSNKQLEWLAAATEGDLTLEEGKNITLASENKGNVTSKLNGNYTFTFDPNTMTFKAVKGQSGIDSVEVADDADAVYYNLQGVRVENPEKGIYIRVANGKATKVVK